MSDGAASSLGIVAYLALFAAVGILFLLVNLLVGWLVRPRNPHEEKLEIYECGEPTIGSSFVQFDLRFYVVALLFIIFDVEVAFFFPWATVFGKSTHLAEQDPASVVRQVDGKLVLDDDVYALYREMGIREPSAPQTVPPTLEHHVGGIVDPAAASSIVVTQGARQLALVTIFDIGAFFAILMVGFAYVWKRGDLDWVRAVSRERAMSSTSTTGGAVESEAALSA